MTKRISPDERFEHMHWEGIVRAMIDQIGPDGLAEVIDYVIDEMRADEEALVNFVIETRRDH